MKTAPVVVDTNRLRRAAGHAVAALKVLGNEDRMLLLCELAQGEMSVGALEERLRIRQPTLSQQLRVLRDEGSVQTRREGRSIYYSVTDPVLLELLAVLYRHYCPKDRK